jgi:hypothetical protein
MRQRGGGHAMLRALLAANLGDISPDEPAEK